MTQIAHALVPGTFDPITFGHIDVVRRARRLFPRVTVAVAESLGKRGGTTFTLDERVSLAREALADMPGVAVERLRARAGGRRRGQGTARHDGL